MAQQLCFDIGTNCNQIHIKAILQQLRLLKIGFDDSKVEISTIHGSMDPR